MYKNTKLLATYHQKISITNEVLRCKVCQFHSRRNNLMCTPYRLVSERFTALRSPRVASAERKGYISCSDGARCLKVGKAYTKNRTYRRPLRAVHASLAGNPGTLPSPEKN